MPRLITVIGLASQQEITTIKGPFHKDASLLEILRSHGIPIASSCFGDGVCQKCSVIINEKPVLSCLLNVFKQSEQSITIAIDYL